MQKIVIKYGGSVRGDGQAADDLLEQVAYFSSHGNRWMIIHGGGSEITSWLGRLGHVSEFKNGKRVTDRTALDVVEMVLTGRVGKWIMRELEKQGAKAVSLSGEDHGLLKVVPYDQGNYGYVGEVEIVDTELISLFWQTGYIPVVAPVGVDAEGHVYNVNADTAAGAIAGAVNADLLIMATDVSGVKESLDDPEAIPELTVSAARMMIKDGRAAGGMIPKLESAIYAIGAGVKAVMIVNGRQPGVIDQILRGQRVGTRIVPDTEGSV